MQLFQEPRIDFIGIRKFGYLISGIALLITIILLVSGTIRMGVDFTGGRLLHVRFEDDTVTIGEVRGILSEIGFDRAEVQTFGDKRNLLIRLPVSQAEEENRISDIEDLLEERYGASHEVVRVEDVGPKIGGELQNNAIKAVIWALLLLLVYISWRFELRFAVGAVFALAHDVLITLGAFMISGREMSLPVVAALLTIVGYSLNDTIVVFDRIREQLRLKRREAFESVVNISLNKSLSRTVITSLTTLIVVVILFIFGGFVINDFAFALLVGVIAGTYSSLFVASPVVVEWHHFFTKRNQKGQSKRK